MVSLKTFHILFITLSIALCAGFAVWALRSSADHRELSVWAGISVAACLALLVYGVWFLKKIRRMGL